MGLHSSAVCGLIEPSYIPAPEVVQLRLLTRRMRSYKQRQTQVKMKFTISYNGPISS